MIMVFEAKSTDKAKIAALLEADPYGKPCFSRNGYKLRDEITVSQDKEKVFLYMKCTDEFSKFAKEKLAGIMEESKPGVSAAVAKVIADEEANSEVGFGSIFGD
jgi:hypothetical protein